MTSESISPRTEEIIFYVDLTTNFLKKKAVLKGLKEFMEKKNKINTGPPTLYGVLMFLAKEKPLVILGADDINHIIESINKSWDQREDQKSYLENGLFELFSYIFWKSRTTKKLYQIVIISDKPSELPEDYYNAAYGLILKAKKFSTFINIIRVGNEPDYPDTVKLKIISSETQGGIFYCSDDKHFLSVLNSLIQNRDEFKIISKEDEILESDKSFFEHLAVDLISLDGEEEEICSLCNQEKCPICQAYSDEVTKCFNCNTKFHGCCATKYAATNNIGIPHIFRCPECSTLLKIQEEFVEMFMAEEKGEDDFYTIDEIEEEAINLENIREEIVPKSNNEVTEKLSKNNLETPISEPNQPKKVRIGGFFGKEIEVKSNGTLNGQNNSSQKVVDVQNLEVKTSITRLNPPKKRKSIKLCHICGATVNTRTCPNCGADIL